MNFYNVSEMMNNYFSEMCFTIFTPNVQVVMAFLDSWYSGSDLIVGCNKVL